MVGAPERPKQLYGLVLPIHRERAGLRCDSFMMITYPNLIHQAFLTMPY